MLDKSLMEINRASAWEELCAVCLMEMSCLVELTHIVEVPCLTKYHVSWKCHAWKKYFHKGFQQVTNEIWHGATPVKYVGFN